MSKKFIKQLIGRLRDDLEVEPSDDFIGDLFEERAENIHATIGSNSEYIRRTEIISNMQKKIIEKIDNLEEIAPLVEKHNNTLYDRNYLCEKLMYKHGVLDGILFIVEGLGEIDITKILKNNK